MSKATRQRSARDRLAAERRRQAQRRRRMRQLAITFAAVAVAVIAVVVVVIVQSNRDKPSGYQGALAPQTRQPDGSVVMAKPGVQGPELVVFEDFQCPACKEFESLNGDTIKRLAVQGKLKVVYRPFRLFTDEPLKSNSNRAASEALCAPADKWVPYHDLIYKHQPAEGSTGFALNELVSWGEQAGITGSPFKNCVTSQQKMGQVDQMTQFAAGAGVKGTPTVTLNGRPLTQEQVFTKDGFEKAVLGAPATAPSPGAGAAGGQG